MSNNFFSGIQENVMNETIFGENAEKSDLKLAVKAEVSHRFKCVFPLKKSTNKILTSKFKVLLIKKQSYVNEISMHY